MGSSQAPDTGEISEKNIHINSPMASDDDLQEEMSELRLDDDGPGAGASSGGQAIPYPGLPGQPDCIYYLRTGMCAYGNNCRYNHPIYIGQETQYTGELPQREGQPDCQFYLKTGTCKFGATCKYHHPKDKLNTRPVFLNVVGLPMREGEKSCPYYMKTGLCKYGSTCKFNHPQPAPAGPMYPVTGSPVYGSTSSMASPSGVPLIGGLPAWPLPRAPYIPSPRVQTFQPYMPVVLQSGQPNVPVQQSWSTFTPGAVSSIPSVDVGTSNLITGMANNSLSGPSTPMNLPERPDQPECQFYLKNGSCKYGALCKYHHPKERIPPSPVSAIGPFGLPLRSGQPICPQYSMYGSCKFGISCKFDHPLIGYYNYALPAYPLQDPSAVFPEQRGSQVRLTLLDSPPPKALRQSDQQVIYETTNNLQDTEHTSPLQPSPSLPQNHSD